jgi:hypothetical protein
LTAINEKPSARAQFELSTSWPFDGPWFGGSIMENQAYVTTAPTEEADAL